MQAELCSESGLQEVVLPDVPGEERDGERYHSPALQQHLSLLLRHLAATQTKTDIHQVAKLNPSDLDPQTRDTFSTIPCADSDLLAALGEGVDVWEQRGEAGGDEWSFVLGPVQTAPPGKGRQRLRARHLLMEGIVRLTHQHFHLHQHIVALHYIMKTQVMKPFSRICSS